MVRQQRLVAVGVALTVGLAAFVAGSPHARAAFVGKNGFIAFAGDRKTGKLDIWTISPGGKGANDLTTGNGLRDRSPAFSPEAGVHIAWVASRCGSCPGDIWVMDNRGGHKHNVTHSSDKNEQSPSWSSSGGLVAFSRGPGSGGPSDIYTIGWQGGAANRLTTNGGDDVEPVFAPVGRLIAWVSNRTGAYGIYVMNPSGTDVRLVVADGRSPNWSPQATRLVFVRAGNLWTVKPDGTGQQQLTTTGLDSAPAYSPDGRRIAFQRGKAVMVMNTDGTHAHRVTGTSVRATEPDWRPECNFNGTRGPNRLVGTAAPELFCGGPGNDAIYAGGGSDAIYGGPGADTVYGGAGNDFVEGGNGVYKDSLYGKGGNDFLMANAGNDVVVGGGGSDFLLGGPGDDRVLGRDGTYGNDSVVGMSGEERRGDTCSADRKASLRLPHDNVASCEHMLS